VPDGVGVDGFALNAQAIDRGRKAAGWVRQTLQPLALDESAWQRRLAARARPSEPRTLVAALEVAGLQRIDPRAVTRHLNQVAGEPLDTAGLHRDLWRSGTRRSVG
jgi:NTE family protein